MAHQSRGTPVHVAVDGAARPFFEAGRALYYERQGQLNLSCAQCHEENWGKRLRVERISQGHPTGFPAYRLEWQTMGSLHRRLRACFQGVRAEPFASGTPELVALELYLGWRARRPRHRDAGRAPLSGAPVQQTVEKAPPGTQPPAVG